MSGRPAARLAGVTGLALLAFAGNSLLCRLALRATAIDAASFTALRLVSGAFMLALLLRWRGGAASARAPGGSWPSALALFGYAAGFSFAYRSLTAATGALLLFGAVQATMIGVVRWRGERMGARRRAGLGLALAGLLLLLLPGLQSPPLVGSLLMLGAGAAWGAYTLRGRGDRGADGQGDALQATAGNFRRAVLPALALGAAGLPWASIDAPGAACALASGALTSGLGYALWYSALPALSVGSAAALQLAVPVITAFGGVLLLAEPLTARLLAVSVLILGGIALVVLAPRSSAATRPP